MPRDPYVRDKFTREVKTARAWRAIILRASQKIYTRPPLKTGGTCSAIITNLR
jgi:hypothetical protein